MSFKLLKRGHKGKMEAQEVVVPASTSLAAQVSRNEEASREEISIIKARVRCRLATTFVLSTSIKVQYVAHKASRNIYFYAVGLADASVFL